MTLKQLYESTTNNLSEDQQLDLMWLLLELLNYSKSDYYLNLDKKINSKTIKKYLSFKKSYLNKNIPVQQLVGYTYFYGYKFYINKHTLIPRKETELLVEETMKVIEKYFLNKTNLNILDLATGSGVIGITLKKLTNANVTLSDISQKALKIANKNIKYHQVDIKTIKSNWFENISNKYDVIITNPPYIGLNEPLAEKVLKDPKNALYSGLDGLDSYKEIFKEINNHLNDKAIIALEHGYLQQQVIVKIIEKNMKEVKIETYQDYQNLDRIIIVTK